jgi:hypothetical protein
MTTENDDDQSISIMPQLSVVESQERANIDMLIATAKKYPRDIVRVKRSMEAMATLDEDTAESCNYHLERNGKSIDGPSVRMAEIAVATYQNIRCGSRVISNDGKVITGQAFCHDLENNTFIAWETQRRITDKTGRTYGEDMQVVTGNAASAIAFRNAVFKVIPGALIKPVAEKARQVAVGDLKTLSERRTRALKKFGSIGVKEDRVLAFLGRSSTEQIDIVDVEKLFGVFTAIREGSTTIEEQFPPISKVVEPNFDQPAAGVAPADPGPEKATVPAETTEPPKRPRGRPPGSTSRKAEESTPAPQTPAEASAPAAAMPTPEPPQKPAETPAANAAIPPAEGLDLGSAKIDYAGPKASTKSASAPKPGPFWEIHKRLADQGISHERFLLAMHSFGFIDCDPADISAGHFPLSKVEEKHLRMALHDWQSVLDNLPEV